MFQGGAVGAKVAAGTSSTGGSTGNSIAGGGVVVWDSS